MKRPRAPIACFRCHHKKVRCDGAHPFCTRCQSTGSSCSYPSSRRSRNTQPHHVDPYIDHLSQLEHHIRQIEADMTNYRSMLIATFASSDPNSNSTMHPQEDILRSHLTKTEQEVQESRTILAQLRLRGEQRIARTKRNQTKEAKQKQQQQQQRRPHSHSKKKPSATTSRSKPSPPPVKPDASPSMDTTSTLFLDQHHHHHQHQPYVSSSSATRPAPPHDLTTSHVPSFLSLNTTTSDALYPSYAQQQQQPDLYYMSGGARAYYDPMMEYPWTTPTDFSNEAKHEPTKDKLWVKQGDTHPESAHYSPSTVAAIEEVTRLAQHSIIHADRSLN